MSSRRKTQGTLQPSDWPGTGSTVQGDEDVYVYFHGLFAFGHNDQTGLCEVGTHSRTSNHQFELEVYEVGVDRPKLVYSFRPKSYKSAGPFIFVDVENPDPCTQGVSFFLPDIGGGQDADWLKVPDFEQRLYGEVLKKKKNVQRPKIFINNARFVVVPTDYEFLAVTEEAKPTVIPLGKISFFAVGATKQRDPVGYVSLINDKGLLTRLKRDEGKKLVLFFANICPQDKCDPTVSDFGEYYKMFKRPPGTKKFKLVKKEDSIATKNTTTERLAFFDALFGKKGVLVHLLSSQDAPCGPTGFGLGGGGTSEPPG